MIGAKFRNFMELYEFYVLLEIGRHRIAGLAAPDTFPH